ncbi:MAG: hypothetical protein COX90_00230 [Candidatus Nealsonbacteria bacterium CG_4_10_14_0_2_um_filter_38_17]|uniref:Uncharacterized protein n=2 Tax=Candidatus Nealsoniibacteriota TaxID=1817911 RepID=A0A2M7UZ94_9BACT|nr:MAG: hypothetical protein COX36_03535 [Candidatus Nealsonbacteria bacterium CG23_combo_of_CG06-09_8_20_14_all_38_19]PIZ89270.1 MAG: hypothetical protein COX90_00230 [Candidatus Nealsonbacteria bacterium CG_4_10_14_0_2_um_filter_38_17]
MEIVKCDKCKKVKKPQKGKLSSETGWISGSVRGGSPWEIISFDLCENCSRKLTKFVKSYLAV